MLVAATLLVAIAGEGAASAAVRPDAASGAPQGHGVADRVPSDDARRVADWVSRSADNGGLPYMIVDKIDARLFLFAADGTLRATTPVLLGLARGDDSPPGIGTRKLSAITPAERITPAGRFVVEPGRNLAGQDLLWIDYDAAVALHRASDRTPNSGGRSRTARLSGAAADKRISLGCINVSAAFYDGFIRPTFSRTKGIAYILPETRSTIAQFNIPGDGRTVAAAGL